MATEQAQVSEPTFLVEGERYTLEQMLASNADDPELIDWLKTAKPGDKFPALVYCVCVGA